MKTLLIALLVFGLSTSPTMAQALRYNEPVPVPSSSGRSNIVPILGIAGAVLTTGYVIFKVKKAKKKSIKARFNIYAYQNNGGTF